MTKITLTAIGVLLLTSGASWAQDAAAPAKAPDQSYVLDDAPKIANIPPLLTGPGVAPNNTISPTELSQANVGLLVAYALTQYDEVINPETSYVLHLIQHKDGSAGSVRDAWYLYSSDWLTAPTIKMNDPDWAVHYKGARLFGARKISLLYIHYNVPVGPLPPDPSNLPELADPKAAFGPNKQSLALIPGSATQYTEETFLPITYSIDISKKASSIVDNLKAVLGQFNVMGGPEKPTMVAQYKALIGAQLDMRIDYPTSNITFSGQRGKTRTNIGSLKADNERKYWLDFGFSIPLSKISELKLGDGNVLQPRPVEKSNIYGTVSIFPFGSVDTKANKVWFRSPQLMYGMALNSKPWDNHLLAIGFLNKYVQPFVGMTLTNKQVRPAQGNDLGLKWSMRIAYGISIPASSIASFIKKSGN